MQEQVRTHQKKYKLISDSLVDKGPHDSTYLHNAVQQGLASNWLALLIPLGSNLSTRLPQMSYKL
jgi:hypothetical protein